MIIEREDNNIIIRLDATLIDIEIVQQFADQVRLLESNAKNKGSQQEADELARESQKGWWAENRHRFVK